MEKQTKVNVAPSSDAGHYIEKSKQVICLDEINEVFRVKGESELTTKNHTTLKNKEGCLITCQMVYDPFKKSFEKAKD